MASWIPLVAGGAAALYKAYQDSQNNNNVAQAGQAKLQNLREATAILEQQRQQRFQTAMNALANQTGSYQGAMNVLASMYGQKGSVAPNLALGGGGPTMGKTPGPPPAVGMPGIGSLFGKPGGAQPQPIRSIAPASGSDLIRAPDPTFVTPSVTPASAGGGGASFSGAGPFFMGPPSPPPAQGPPTPTPPPPFSLPPGPRVAPPPAPPPAVQPLPTSPMKNLAGLFSTPVTAHPVFTPGVAPAGMSFSSLGGGKLFGT